MPLVNLELHNFRIYERVQIEPCSRLNLIYGANAGGKTSLLEAIHLLGTGRSFRTSQAEQLTQYGALEMSVMGELNLPHESITSTLRLTQGTGGRRASINGLVQKQVSSLAAHLPLQVISPDTHYEFQHNSKHRRGVLDWGLFHVEPGFSGLWTRYQRVLQQRNAALKNRDQIRVRHVWDDELIETGTKLHKARAQLIAQLIPHYQFYCQQLLGSGQQIDLILEPGWDLKRGFPESLRQDQYRDQARGFTHSGPQRADIQIYMNLIDSRQAASHGQFKLLVIALRLAQVRFLLESEGRSCCLLIDDLAAELDPEHRARITQLLAKLPVQTFITATELSAIDRNPWPIHKTFHVEQGMVVE